MKVVCLDPGHGGSDPGALGPDGLRESDMTLDVCKRARTLLEQHPVTVVMTRDEDKFVGLAQRADYANAQAADAFISYHFNSAASPLAHGFEIFTTRGQNNSDKLATAIGKRHGVAFPGQKQRQDWADGDLDKEANFSVIRRADCPAVLVEGEFIHTTEGAAWIAAANNRQRMAKAVSDGVLDFLAISGTNPGLESTKPVLTLEQRVARLERLAGL